MSEKVLLTLTGRQRDGTGEEAVTTLCTEADYHEKNGGLYLLYEERPERSGSPVKNILKLKGDTLEQTKRGGINAHMVFSPGKEHMTDYVTPYGCLKMGILTKSLKSFPENGYPRIRVKYALTADGRPLSDCVLTISIRPAGSAAPR